jgi:hypothetical protein
MDSQLVKIYSKKDSPRLRYVADVILGDILGISWEIINDKRKLGKHPIINYSHENLPGSFKISPAEILFETGVCPKQIIISEWKGLSIFFQTDSDSDLQFDIFGASFYLMTRYEEYLEFKPDEYGRFCSSSSLAYKYGFLEKPVIDLWTNELAKAFLKRFPSLVFKRNDYSAMLTIDTDQPFKHLGKNFFRSIGGLFRNKHGISEIMAERYHTVFKGEKDPFDVFDYIIENIEKYKTEARFFFPFGNYSKYDKNPSWKNKEYRKLIRKIAERYQIGLHPSFYAGTDGPLVISEANRFQAILGMVPFMSRFHYIRFCVPGSYNNILLAGIAEDYSMGYPDEPGFRAGIARPFFFYSVLDDIRLNLRIIPFQVMDCTMYDYKKLDPAKAKEVIFKLINETKKVGGLFVSIWHNTSLLDNDEWKGWREVYEYTLKNQKP